jgi:hypothetical protein
MTRAQRAASLRGVLALAITCASTVARADGLSESTDGDHGRVVHLALEPLLQYGWVFDDVTLVVSGRIGRADDIEVTFIQQGRRRCGAAEVALAANSRAVALRGKLESSSTQQHLPVLDLPEGSYDRYLFSTTVHAHIARSTLAALAAAKRVHVHGCRQTYELSDDQRTLLGELAHRLANH